MDHFAVASYMRKMEPEHFQILTEPISSNGASGYHAVIELDPSNEVVIELSFLFAHDMMQGVL